MTYFDWYNNKDKNIFENKLFLEKIVYIKNIFFVKKMGWKKFDILLILTTFDNVNCVFNVNS